MALRTRKVSGAFEKRGPWPANNLLSEFFQGVESQAV